MVQLKRICLTVSVFCAILWMVSNTVDCSVLASQDGATKKDILVVKPTSQRVMTVGISEDYHKVKAALMEYKSQKGVAPNDEVFFAMIFDPKYDICDLDQAVLWNDLVKLQSPQITLENLRSLVAAKRNSIRDFYCDFSVIRENEEAGNDPEIGKTTYKCAYKNNLFFVERQKKDDHSRVAFSGDLFIKVWFHPSVQANILPPPASLHDGFVPMMPLFQSMIGDAGVFHTHHAGFDLLQCLDRSENMCVFEQTELIDGRKYLVLGNFTKRLLLDIERDFSVYQFLGYTYQSGPLKSSDPSKTSRMISRTRESERSLTGLTDYGNGIWLPKKAENLYFSGQTGKVTMSDVVTYNGIKLNQGLKAEFFEDVIPEDALVTDSIRDMVYAFSDRASINGLIKDVTKSKRVMIFRYISVTVGLALIVLALFMKYREYQKRKNAT